MKDIELTQRLANKYFEGKLLPEEESELFEFLDTDPQHLQQFRQWEKEWISQRAYTPEMDAQWEKMRRKWQVSQSITPQPVCQSSRIVWMKAMSVAAAVVVVLLSAWALFSFRTNVDNQTYYLCSAAYGEKSKVVLTDGTAVWLNAGSSLRYSNQFGWKNREVYLQGEGYFEVTKQKEQDFVVHTDIYDVVVKGTKFNVSAYADDPVVTTTLLEGSVDISYGKEVMKLLPGERINYLRNSQQFERKQVDAEQSKAWAEKRIEYADITLRELTAKLSRQYDVSIQLAPSAEQLSEKSFRISLRNGETVDDVLSALKAILPISVERKEQVIVIK